MENSPAENSSPIVSEPPIEPQEIIAADNQEPIPNEPIAATLESSSIETVAIGDSVMLGAKGALKESLENVTVNAAVGRQFTEVYRIVKKLKRTNKLPPFVFIHTGTNGTIEKETLVDMMELLRDCRKVVIFDLRVPRKWQDSNNRILNSVVPRYENAVLVDWQKESSSRKGVFCKDGIHLNPKGAAFYAQLVSKALINNKQDK
jgi:lysophospholipase L1-like esterase